jgi:hypothetical protein
VNVADVPRLLEHPPSAIDPVAGTRVCSRCSETKLLSEFYPSRINKTGILPHGKACHLVDTRKTANAWRANNLERAREYQRAYYREARRKKRKHGDQDNASQE